MVSHNSGVFPRRSSSSRDCKLRMSNELWGKLLFSAHNVCRDVRFSSPIISVRLLFDAEIAVRAGRFVRVIEVRLLLDILIWFSLGKFVRVRVDRLLSWATRPVLKPMQKSGTEDIM